MTVIAERHGAKIPWLRVSIVLAVAFAFTAVVSLPAEPALANSNKHKVANSEINSVIVEFFPELRPTLELERAQTKNLVMLKNASYNLAAKVSHGSVTYKSSRPKIVSVNENGTLFARAQGNAVVTVKASHHGAKTVKKVRVKVVPKPEYCAPRQLQAKLLNERLPVGWTTKLKVATDPENASNKNFLYSSSDPSIAQITAHGVVTAIGPGDAILSVTSCDNPNAKASVLLRVTDGVNNYDFSFANAPKTLDLNTYTGQKQVLHPKVLYFPEGFASHEYWMAYTPYPNHVVAYENPCIAYSDDGIKWENISGNPLDDPGGIGYNSDTHLVYNEAMGLLECWYRYVSERVDGKRTEILYRRTSSDGFSWSPSEVMLYNDSGQHASFLSPSVLIVDDVYHMWVVDNTDARIKHYTMCEPDNWTLQGAADVSFGDSAQGSETYKPWHMDVISDNGTYVFLVSCKNWDGHPLSWPLYLFTSSDNETYTKPYCVLQGRKGCWDALIYRSSIVKTGMQYRIYYSARNDRRKVGTSLCVSDSLNGFVGYPFTQKSLLPDLPETRRDVKL